MQVLIGQSHPAAATVLFGRQASSAFTSALAGLRQNPRHRSLTCWAWWENHPLANNDNHR
jgi:hypothetical protein